jgi:murein DD-endopeptidase MepM/ murein hydrolase activator NlpD
MKTFKYTNYLSPQQRPVLEHHKPFSLAKWGVFLASFVGTLLVVGVFNTVSRGSGEYTATAQEQEKVKVVYQDLTQFMQFMSMVRNNVSNDRPLFSYFPVYPKLNTNDLRGLGLPIANTFIPLSNPSYFPNSAREYRNGTHQGFDVPAVAGTKVYSVYYGEVVRVDSGFTAITADQYQAMIAEAMKADITPEYILDKIRGRQVWIDHGGGVVSRYCHLSQINEDLKVGAYIEKGQYLGNVGKSGLEYTYFGSHLHFELWIKGKYLGDGLSYEQIKKTVQRAFSS